MARLLPPHLLPVPCLLSAAFFTAVLLTVFVYLFFGASFDMLEAATALLLQRARHMRAQQERDEAILRLRRVCTYAAQRVPRVLMLLYALRDAR